MKIIEAMKLIKRNDEKIADLQSKIRANAAHLNIILPEYDELTVKGWVQACNDISSENVRLLVAIQRTNIQTSVSIQLGEKLVTKTIAEWIWWRRRYAETSRKTFEALTDNHLKTQEGKWVQPKPDEAPVQVTIIRRYDPVERDAKVALYREEPSIIDAALETVNAITDLVD